MSHRILHILPSLDPDDVGRQAMRLATSLPDGLFDVHVCALAGDGLLAANYERAGVPLTRISRRRSLDPGAWWRLKRHITRLRPDVVHTWPAAGNAYGRPAARAAGARRLVASERHVDSRQCGWRRWLDRRLFARTWRVVAASDSVRECCLHAAASSPARAAEGLEVIVDGVSQPDQPVGRREQLLGLLGLENGARLVGTTGPLVRQRRLKDIIWAVELLRNIRDDVHLVIVGNGDDQECGFDQLRRYSELVEITRHVHFLPTPPPPWDAEPGGWLSHLDLYVSASAHEGVAAGVLDAMAAGVAVVASDIAAHRELITHGETGVLLPVGDAAGLATWVHKLLNSAALRETLGEAARRHVAAQFSVGKMVSRYAALYRRLCAEVL